MKSTCSQTFSLTCSICSLVCTLAASFSVLNTQVPKYFDFDCLPHSSVVTLNLVGMFIPARVPLLDLLGYFPKLSALSLDYNLIGPPNYNLVGPPQILSQSGTLTPADNDTLVLESGHKLGAFLNSIPRLEQLSLNRNPLLTFDNVLNTSRQIKSLSLMSTELYKVPFPLPPSLKVLHLCANNIEALPAGIFRGLSNLEMLSLRNNKITSIAPGVFEELRSLRYLDLGSNSLTTLPNGSLAGLSNLMVLNLTNNKLADLHSIDGLGSLRMLSLASNHLRNLTKRLFRDLVNIASIELEKNNLTSFDPRILPSPENLVYL